MSRTSLSVLTVSAVLVLTGGLGAALASGGGITAPTTIRTVAKVTDFGQDHPTSQPPAIGYTYALHGTLWNTAQTHQIGRFDVVCTYTTQNAAYALCDATFRFGTAGEISSSGVSPTSGAPDTDPITGGDGSFRNVRGQVDVGNSSGATIPITLELQP
jgi:hypothetical protein